MSQLGRKEDVFFAPANLTEDIFIGEVIVRCGSLSVSVVLLFGLVALLILLLLPFTKTPNTVIKQRVFPLVFYGSRRS